MLCWNTRYFQWGFRCGRQAVEEGSDRYWVWLRMRLDRRAGRDIIRKYFHYVVFLVTALCCAAILLFLTGRVPASESAIQIRNFMVFEDTTGQLDFSTICRPDFADRFHSYKGDDLSLGVSASVFWVRFSLPTVADGSKRLFLQFANPNISWLRVYFPVGEGPSLSYVEKQGGQSQRPMVHEVWTPDWAFVVPNGYPAGGFVFLRLESISALRLPVQLWSEKDFFKNIIVKDFLYGGFYGILLAMLLYNLFIALALRDGTYSFYVLYIFFMLIYQLNAHGHLALWFQLSPGLYNVLFWLCLAAVFAFSILFTERFLQLESEQGMVHILLRGCLAMAVLCGLLGLAGKDLWANLLAHGLGIFEPVFFVTAAWLRWQCGFRPAGFYLLAWGILALGILSWVISPSRLQAENILMIATASEAVLLSLALSSRFKALKVKEMKLIDNVHYYRDLSFTDDLTGLYNRRYMKEIISQEMAQAVAGQSALALAILDIDFFKNYNDTYGHWYGDQVLKCFSKIILENLSSSQTAFRFGGEEFVILFPALTSGQTLVVLDKIRRQFANEVFAGPQDSPTHVTVSGGLAGLQTGDSFTTLFQRADQLLYEAKAAGRNCIVVREPTESCGR